MNQYGNAASLHLCIYPACRAVLLRAGRCLLALPWGRAGPGCDGGGHQSHAHSRQGVQVAPQRAVKRSDIA